MILIENLISEMIQLAGALQKFNPRVLESYCPLILYPVHVVDSFLKNIYSEVVKIILNVVI